VADLNIKTSRFYLKNHLQTAKNPFLGLPKQAERSFLEFLGQFLRMKSAICHVLIA
jgi:hypothetical protein